MIKFVTGRVLVSLIYIEKRCYHVMVKFLLTVISLLIISDVQGQPDPSVCIPVAVNTTVKLPTLADRYFTRVEVKNAEDRKWTYIEEYYDGPGNRAAVKVTGFYDPGQTDIYISNFKTGEYYSIQDGDCSVSKISKDDTFTLPFTTVNGSTDDIVSVYKALKFAKNTGRYLGRGNVRDIATQNWQSCTYDSSKQSTTKVNFYFSGKENRGRTLVEMNELKGVALAGNVTLEIDCTAEEPIKRYIKWELTLDSCAAYPSSWPSPSGAQACPVRCIIHTKIGRGNQAYESHTQYDYVYFQEFFDDLSVFQVPRGIYCSGRVSTKTPPAIPEFFNFRAEMIVNKYKALGAYNEWYDYKRKLVRIDSRPIPGDVIVLSSVPRREVHDFLTGISFILNMENGACEVVPITPDVFDAKLTNINLVSIRSPQEFFEFATGNFVYSGETVERSVPMDTWIGVRTDWPAGLNKTSYWEWYFSKDNWRVSEFGQPVKDVPMRLKISVPSLNTTFVYNIFQFSKEEPDISIFDVTYCYEEKDIRNFRFSLKGNAWAIAPDPRRFKYDLATAIVNTMGVAHPRVQSIQAEYDRDGVYVMFTLLSPPRVKGDVQNPINRVSSQYASDIFQKILDSGTFFFQSGINRQNSGVQLYNYTGVPHSLQEVIRAANGSLISIVDRASTPSRSVFTVTTPTPSSTHRTTTPLTTSAPSARATTSTSGISGGITEGLKHSNNWSHGSVAGIALGMTCFGLVLGVLCTFLVLKFRGKEKKSKQALPMSRVG